MGIRRGGAGKTSSTARVRPSTKRADDMLSSVIAETATAGAVELLKKNEAFAFPSGTAWSMLVLEADDIGGLSRRDKKDATKGSICQLIESDQIKVVATREMLDEEVFGIIPEPETLDRMGEYSLLTGAHYSWAVVWLKPNGEMIVDLVANGGYNQALAVQSGLLSLRAVVGEQAWAEHSGETGPGFSPTLSDAEALAAQALESPSADSAEDPGDDLFDDAPDQTEDDSPVFDDAPDESDLDEIAFEPQAAQEPKRAEESADLDDEAVPAFDDEADEAPAAAWSAPEDDPEAGADPFETARDVDSVGLADQEEARSLIARRFLSDGLALDVRLDELEATMGLGAPAISIDLPQEATEWLGGQVAHLTRQGNAALAQQRAANDAELRTLYVDLMSKLVEQTLREVDIHREGSRYRAINDGLAKRDAERSSGKDEEVRKRRAEIVAEYEAEAGKAATAAANAAEAQYRERHRTAMERRQTDALGEIERRIEDDHERDLAEVLSVRENDASLKMQMGATAVLEVVAERRTEMLDAEAALLTEWKDQILAVVDEHRKDDMARAQALAEQLSRTDEIGEVKRSHEAEVSKLRADQAEQLRRADEDLQRAKAEAVASMSARDAEWSHTVDLEKGKTEAALARVTDLIEQSGAMEETIRSRYEAQILDLQDARDSYAMEMDRAGKIQDRSNKIMTVLVPTVALLVGVVGFILGVVFF